MNQSAHPLIFFNCQKLNVSFLLLQVGLTFSGSSLLDGLPYTCEFSSIQNLSLPGSPLENFSGENGTGSCFFPKTTPEIIPFDSGKY